MRTEPVTVWPFCCVGPMEYSSMPRLKDDRSFVVDCLEYRKGKDAELRQMARFMMERAKSSGAPQEMGPLNPYARRLVHLTVAEDPQMSSESIGDAFLKTVIIAVRK